MVKIKDQYIGRNYPPYVVAELSANHNGSIEKAKKMIDLAKLNGADAVKIQSYEPDDITLNSKTEKFKIISEGGKWNGVEHYVYGSPEFKRDDVYIVLLKKDKNNY